MTLWNYTLAVMVLNFNLTEYHCWCDFLQSPGKSLDSTSNRLRPLFAKFFPSHHSCMFPTIDGTCGMWYWQRCKINKLHEAESSLRSSARRENSPPFMQLHYRVHNSPVFQSRAVCNFSQHEPTLISPKGRWLPSVRCQHICSYLPCLPATWCIRDRMRHAVGWKDPFGAEMTSHNFTVTPFW
jgi:hypothetical protein